MPPCPGDLASFVDLIIADDMDAARDIAGRVIGGPGGRDALLLGLLTQAARLLGRMWERDSCDFMTVTLGVHRLNQIMRETATAGSGCELPARFDHRILLVPAPGEQHGFGLGMVADAFREGGWCVRSGPAISRAQLLRLARGEWFDVIGFSIMTDQAMAGLSAIIRAVRAASRNRNLFIMVGGQMLADHAERTRFLGADAAPGDAQEALAAANIFVETTMTETSRHSSRGLVDRG